MKHNKIEAALERTCKLVFAAYPKKVKEKYLLNAPLYYPVERDEETGRVTGGNCYQGSFEAKKSRPDGLYSWVSFGFTPKELAISFANGYIYKLVRERMGIAMIRLHPRIMTKYLGVRIISYGKRRLRVA